MLRQMCWLPLSGSYREKVLHLRIQPNQPWQPYNAFPAYTVPDYRVPGGSKGWSTYQKLIREGWTLIPTEQAQQWVAVQQSKSA